MYLKTHSPHLSYFIEKIFSEIPQCIEESFKFAMDRGGVLELDYQREEGQSFNPRPARIALIGIKDGGINDLESIQLLILSALLERGKFCESVESKEILTAFPNINKNRILKLEEICTSGLINKEYLSNSETCIYLCLFIDRMRHSHLSGPKKVKEEFDRLDPSLIVLPHSASNLQLIIKSWKEKMARQFPELLR